MDIASYLVRARADVTIKSMIQKTAFQLCKDIKMQDALAGWFCPFSHSIVSGFNLIGDTAIAEEVARERREERREREEIMKQREEEHLAEVRQQEEFRRRLEEERLHVLNTRSIFIAAIKAVVEVR